MLDLKNINNNWTLFLDRDGVINHEKKLDYVYNFDEFIFYDGVLKALNILASRFNTIVVTTNQKGIGKGLMTEADLHDIHIKMKDEIVAAGGRIDGIYFCTALNDEAICRKPNTGMAFEAQKDFPHIDFSTSLIVGNNISDMEFGRNAGMHTVFVKTTNPQQTLPHPAIDLCFNNLLNFAEALQQA